MVEARKILLLGATFGADNRGIGALAAGAIAILAKRYPHAQICFLDYGRDGGTSEVEVEGKVRSVPLINLRFSKQAFLPNNIAYLLLLSLLLRLLGPRLRARLIAENRWLALICEADMAAAVSGGDSFSDIYGLGRFFYMCLPQLLMLSLGKRLVLLPQTIGPFQGRLARGVARFLMRRAETVYSRDAEGVRQARALLGVAETDPKVRFCYDMGFLLQPRRPEYLDCVRIEELAAEPKMLVGLNISGLLYIGGYDRSNMFALKADYRDLVDSLIAYLIEEQKANVLLIPHVFGERTESDTTAIAETYRRLKGKYPDGLHCVRGAYDEREIKYVIGLCDFFVGSRMHACIAALSQAIPAVGIAYSRKFSGVLESIGTGQLVADLRELDIEETLGMIGRAYAERAAIKSRLQQAMAAVKQETLHLLAHTA